jgi:hypothetical protein
MIRLMAFTALVCLLPGTGCTARALQQTARTQIASVARFRYQEVMDNLAVVAANPGTIPALAIVADGTATVVDTATFDAKTVLTRVIGLSPTTLSPAFSRNPQPIWTVNPIADSKGLIACWAALRWVVGYLPESGSTGETTLRLFRVDGALANLPPGWLHIGCCADVPHGAVYKAHCGNTWVWVNPEDMAGLSALTLVVLDIGTTDTTALNDGLDARGLRKANVKVEVSTNKDAKGNTISVALDKQPAQQDPKAMSKTIQMGLNDFPSGFGLPQTVSFVPPNGGTVSGGWTPAATLRQVGSFGTHPLFALTPLEVQRNIAPRREIEPNK